jgi:hypothetical protein
MQDYLDTHPAPSRPTYSEITSAKVIDKFPDAYRDNDDIFKAMKDSKSKKGRPVTVGLWTLDFHSCFDWRDSAKNSKKALSEFIQMAKIETAIIAKYRSSLFKNCRQAAFIRTEIATLLADSCKVKPWSYQNQTTQKTETRHMRRFRFADKIPVDVLPPPSARVVDVRELKSKRVRSAKSQALVIEATAALKRLEGLKAVASAPNSKEMDTSIYRNISNLKKVSAFTMSLLTLSYLFTLAHSSKYCTLGQDAGGRGGRFRR